MYDVFSMYEIYMNTNIIVLRPDSRSVLMVACVLLFAVSSVSGICGQFCIFSVFT